MTQGGNDPSTQRTNSVYRVPPQRSGSGSADLHTDSSDTGELRELLGRARERLAFYEGFDRIISENIKRSGELMLETIEYREQAETHAEQARAARAELDAAVQTQRQRHQELMTAVVSELDSLHAQLDAFRNRIEEKLHSFSDPVAESAARAVATATAAAAAASQIPQRPVTPPITRVEQPVPAPAYKPQPAPAPIFERHPQPAPSPVFEPARPAPGAFTPDAAPEPATAQAQPASTPAQPEPAAVPSPPQVTLGPRTIDAMFHGITDPSLALQLQRYLKDIRGVTGVEVREFAEGLLRMRVASTRSLNEGDFSAWPSERKITISVIQPAVIEASIAPAAPA